MITTDVDVTIEKRVSKNLYVLSLKLHRYREWLPGTFLQISIDHKTASEPWLDSRAFSFASWGKDVVKILVRKEGLFTSQLVEKSKSGFSTTVRYPFGDFLLLSEKNKIFIVGGAGISVFMSYLDYVKSEGKNHEKIIIFHSVRNREESLQNIYWDTLPKNVFLWQFITDPEDEKFTGRPSIKNLKRELLNPNAYDFFICGPPQFNSYWLEELGKFGIIPKLEQWINAEAVK
ncbi:MAG: FAD-dependent oxidoreductase [Thermoplasmataceae archaeon]